MNENLVIGTRGSQLSLAQTQIVKDQLQIIFPNKNLEIRIITTTGDRNMKPVPLDSVGKGWFTKELDKALLTGTIDLAVHSLKDIPETLPEGLVIACIPKREDPREALITKDNVPFAKLKIGAIIGTDSTRRKSQILDKRPDLIVKSIRGNVNTRVQKLKKGEYDGIFLAVAGLKRLGMDNLITEYFSPKDMIPSPGQGALAVVVKKENKAIYKALQKLTHRETSIAVKAERAFSQTLGGGCKTPIGAYAEVKGQELVLKGFVGSLNGKKVYKTFIRWARDYPERAGKELARKFLDKGYLPFALSQFVVITRPVNTTIKMQKQIEALGFFTYFFPSIAVAKTSLSKQSKKVLIQLDFFDWIVFTSQNGVRFFLTDLAELGIPISKLKRKKLAAVGEKTAKAIKKYGLSVNFVPSKFTTERLSEELPKVEGKKILMARANLATPLLSKRLKERGAQVTDMPIYETTYIENDNPEFELLVADKKIYCLTFTSPSTVKGFFNNIKNSPQKNVILELPVLSIGPVTTKALKELGFTRITTADTYTINGMIAKLQEGIL